MSTVAVIWVNTESRRTSLPASPKEVPEMPVATFAMKLDRRSHASRPGVTSLVIAADTHDDIEAISQVPHLAYSISQAAIAMGVSRDTVYVLIRAGQIRAVKAGTRTLIPSTGLAAFLNGGAPSAR
jgi:excisionase family DNA binding protein